MIAALDALVAHVAWLLTSMIGGGLVARVALEQLGPELPGTLRPGTRNAGRWIGYAERALVHLAIVAALPWIVPVVVGIKTLVRFPEIQSAARPPSAPAEGGMEQPGGSFVEYYLLGTLTSLAVAVAVGVVARHLVGLGCGATVLGIAVAGLTVALARADDRLGAPPHP